MNTIRKTKLLEFRNSSFLIDLVEHQSGVLYFEITQTIRNDVNEINKQKLKVNPSLLDAFISTLKEFNNDIPIHHKSTEYKIIESENKVVESGNKKIKLSQLKINEIAKRYLGFT